MLRTSSPFTTARAESRFVARGYSTELECRDDVMREGGQTDQHRAALDALHHAAVVAEIVIESVQDIMGDACPAWLRQDASIILGPVLGRMSFRIGMGREETRELPLVDTGELLMACRNFDVARRVVFAEKCSFAQARRYGREGFVRSSEVDHEVYRTIVRGELAGHDTFGQRVDLAGVSLWACQQVARLRIAAGEALLKTSKAWGQEDRRGAIETQWNLMATRIQGSYHDEMPGFETPEIDLAFQTSVQVVERALAGSWSMIEGESEADPDRTLRAVAEWVGRVRRWGFANLDFDIAHALVTLFRRNTVSAYAEAFDTNDAKAALERLGRLFPETMWNQIEAAASQVVADRRSRAVIYDWNDPPVRALGVFETGHAPIVGRGPLLDFPAYENERWARLAHTLGPDGLVILER